MALETKNNKWIVEPQIEVTQSGQNSSSPVTLKTAGKFIDRDIEITAVTNVADGEIAAEVIDAQAGSASIAGHGFTAATESDYYVELSTVSGSAKGKATVAQEGFIAADDVATTAEATEIAVSGNGEKVYIPTNTIAGSIVNLDPGSVAVSATASESIKTSEIATGFYVEVSGAATNGSVQAKATAGAVNGIVAANTVDTSDATVVTPAITGSGTKVNIQASDLTADRTLGYGESTVISEGYTKGATITNSIEAGKVSSEDKTINVTIGTLTDGSYALVGEAHVPAISVDKAGYISETVGDRVAGTVSVSGSVVQSQITGVADDNTVTPIADEQEVKISAGYYPEERTVTVKAMSDAAKAVVGVVAEAPEGYTENTTAVVPSNGYLKIDAGYIGNTVISLETLVPDDANIVIPETGLSMDILEGVTAYDKDGKLVTGGIARKTKDDVTHSAAAVTVPAGYYAQEVEHEINSATVSASAEASAEITEVAFAPKEGDTTKFTVTATGAISGTAHAGLSGAGYVGEDSDTSAVTGTATLAAEVVKANHSVETKATVAENATAGCNNFTVEASSTAYTAPGVLMAAPTGVPYLTITPTIATTAGTANADATCNITEGYTLAVSNAAATQTQVSVPVTQGTIASQYIQIYAGEIA